MKWFNNCTTLNEVKSLYKDLAKQHHPDRGGDTATMQEINNEYTFACAKMLRGENLSQEEMETEFTNIEAYRNAINKIINLEGITIEIVGAWIWVTGNTRPYKDVLKNPEGGQFFWAHKKLAWYFRTEEFKSRNKIKMSLDEIRSKYGSKVINTAKSKKAIEA
jgi:hypothetical protein